MCLKHAVTKLSQNLDCVGANVVVVLHNENGTIAFDAVDRSALALIDGFIDVEQARQIDLHGRALTFL